MHTSMGASFICRYDPYRCSVTYRILKAPARVVELYSLELFGTYPYAHSSAIDAIPVGQDPVYFTAKNGTVLIGLARSEDGTLNITAMDNSHGRYSDLLMAERTSARELKVTSISALSPILVQQGDKVRISASGSISLGLTAGSGGPDGIMEYHQYNIERYFAHGMLMGRIGDGEWFRVGKETTFEADRRGLVYLKVNDNDPSNNAGHFVVTYHVDRVKD